MAADGTIRGTRTHWCTGFLEHLAGLGFEIGLEHHLRIERLLDRIGVGASLTELRSILGPIVATNLEQQQQFREAFNRYFVMADPEPTTGPEAPGEPVTGGAVSREHERITLSKPAPSQTWLLRLIAGVALGLLLMTDRHAPEVMGPEAPRDTSEVPPDPGPGPPTPNPVPVPDPTIRTIAFIRPPLESASWLSTHRTQVRLSLVGLIGALVALIECRRQRRNRAAIVRERGGRPPFSLPVRSPEAVTSLFDPDHLHGTARLLHRRQRGTERRLALEASVAATVDSLGYPTFVYERTTRPPEYLVLIERVAPRDHRARLFATLAQALNDEGPSVTRYFYDHDPRICFGDDPFRGFKLAELQLLHPDHRLVIIGTGDGLLDPESGRLLPWTSALEAWEERVLLTPVPPRAWGPREVVLDGACVVLPATLEGVRSVVESLEGHSRLDLQGWRERDSTPLPPYDGEFAKVSELRKRLGPELFRWLCACAVYPELHWDLTLYLGTLPEIGPRLLTEQNVLQLARLSWFREGRMPDRLRNDLVAEIEKEDRDNRTDVEGAIRRALIAALQIEEPGLDPKSAAAEDREGQRLQQELYVYRHDPAKRKSLIERLLKQVPPEELLEDVTLIRLLRRTSRSRLALLLPEAVSNLLFPRGASELGVTRSAAALIAVAMVGASVWFTRPGGPAVTAIVTDVEGLLLSRGDSFRISAAAFDAQQAPINPAMIGWRSDTRAVATVDDQGMVRALGTGTTTIRARVGDFARSVRVTVDSSLSSTVAVPPNARLPAGEAGALVLPLPNELGPRRKAIEWTNCQPDVLSFESGGVVRALRPGAATYMAASGSTVVLGSLFVSDPTLDSTIETLQTPVYVNSTGGSTGALPLLDSKAAILRANPDYRISLRAATLGSAASGLPPLWAISWVQRSLIDRGVAGGRLEIASGIPGCEQSGRDLPSIGLTRVQFQLLNPPASTQNLILIPASSIINVGGTVQLTVHLGDSAGRDINSLAEWSSADTTIASVTDGQVRGRRLGAVQISARLRDKTVSAAVSVRVGPLIGTPIVTGGSLEDARRVIDRVGLRLGRVDTTVRNTDYQAGMVVEQSPTPGTLVTMRSRVNIVVARAADVVIGTNMPDLAGVTREAATAQLAASKLEADWVSQDVDDDSLVGRVIDQLPAPGVRVAAGARVYLLIGAVLRDPVVVPDLYGSTREDAAAMLAQAGLRLGEFAVERGYTASNRVLSQKPRASARVERGSQVEVLYRAGWLGQRDFRSQVLRRLQDMKPTQKEDELKFLLSPPQARGLVVRLNRAGEGNYQAIGSGIVVGADSGKAYIVTAGHLVRRESGTAPVTISFSSSPDESIAAVVSERVRDDMDIAILTVDALPAGTSFTFDRLGDASHLKSGDRVATIGCPRGECWQNSLTLDEKVVSVDRERITFQSQQVAPGSSGAALFDENWKIVGIVTGVERSRALAIPIDNVLKLARAWGFPVRLH